jgi:ABC-type bacteriocin/lantibiotic exporter with double-glycine peptidase domain
MEPTTPGDGPRKTPLDAEVATLVALADLCAVPAVDLGAARAAMSATGAAHRDERLVLAAGALGLRMERVDRTVDEALAAARPTLPLLGTTPDGRRVIVLSGGRRVQIALPGESDGVRVLPRAELKRLLGASSASELRAWLIAEPTYPADALSTQAGSSPLRRLFSLVRAERTDVTVILIYAVATGVLALAIPLSIQALITWLAFGALLQPIVGLTALVLIVLSVAGVMRALQRHTVEIVQRRLFVRLLLDVTARLTRVRPEAFDRASGPELVNRFFDVLTVQKAAASLLVDGASALLQALVGLALLGLYHPILLAFDAALLVGTVFVLLPLGIGATKSAIVESKRKYQAAAWMEELARQPAAVQLGGARIARQRAEELATAYLRDRASHFRVFFRQYVGMQALQVVVATALLLLCGWLVLEGELTVGQLVAAEFIVTAAMAGFAKLVEKLDTWYDLLAAVDKIGALADLPQHANAGLAAPRGAGPARIALEAVVVDGSDPIDLDVPAGATRRVVVPSNARTLVADVILGLRAPTAGRSLRDGVDLATLRPDVVFAEGAVLRPTGTLVASIRDNVALARPEVDDARVWELLGAVGLADRVASLEGGLDTELGPHGAPLGDLDVTRLLTARALAGRPRIVVVDGMFAACPDEAVERLTAALSRAATVVILDSRAPAATRSAA